MRLLTGATNTRRRAVVLWKEIAERHILLVKPQAYLDAASKKAAKVMEQQNRQTDWLSYLKQPQPVDVFK